MNIPEILRVRPKEFYSDPNKVNYACMGVPARPGVKLFLSTLEYKWFPPGTVKNALFTLTLLEWEDMLWDVVTIPKECEEHAKATAKMTGMRIANGVPVLLSTTISTFPIGGDNVFSVENCSDHPIYKGSMYREAFIKLERKLVEKMFIDGFFGDFDINHP